VIGGHLYSGGVVGRDRATGEIPADAAEQARLMFANVADILAAAGGSLDDVAKVDVVVAESADRTVLNDEWVRRFPDPQQRPARKTDIGSLPTGTRFQCQFVAILSDSV